MGKNRFQKSETIVILLALIGIVLGSLATYGRGVAYESLFSPNAGMPRAGLEDAWRIEDEKNTILTYESAKEGVVLISTSTTSGGRGNGSGFFVDKEGHIVTNHHVIEDANVISVHTYKGGVYEAAVVGADRLTDLAVIKIAAAENEIYPLSMADGESVRVGQKAIVMGSPLATGSSLGLDRSPTVTTGVISAIDRSLPIESLTKPGVNDFTVENLVQTDAAVNPGNSGGPLLNSHGEVVGVITAIIGSANGIGFAIPTGVMAEVVPTLLRAGKMSRAFLGVSYLALDDLKSSIGDDDFHLLGLSSEAGALVTDVEQGGPAEKAGLLSTDETVVVNGVQYPKGGDIIVGIDGITIKGSDLAKRILDYKPGETVSLQINRNGKIIFADVSLGSR